jgi:hypothetical protein
MARGMVSTNGIFLWNVDAHVGQGCPNKVDDVQLVQLGYFCLAKDQAAGVSPQDRITLSKVVPGAAYNGSASDPLTVAIKLHQKLRGGVQDGKVSPVQPSISYNWMLITLDASMQRTLGQYWPRLDLHPNCPAALRAAVIACMTI